MRVRLQKGKQRELILLAKGTKDWATLAKEIGIDKNYLANDIVRERVLLTEPLYIKLNSLAHTNFDSFIIERLGDNWGRSRGGLNSSGSLKKILEPPESPQLAEFIGAVLGDGHVSSIKRGKKIGSYQVTITGHVLYDREYHLLYLRKLCMGLFGIEMKETLSKRSNARQIMAHSRELVRFFTKMGIKPGNKIENQSTIPLWIYTHTSYLKACVRGLIDTDGSIFRMSNQDPQLIRISFTNHNRTLLMDTRKAFVSLGFFPSKIIKDRQFFLSRKSDITTYLKEVGFSNKKHRDRLKVLQQSPVV